MFLIVLAEAIEDPSMITQPKEIKKPAVATPKTFDAAALGATIKQNIVEKLPVINNQVRSVHSMGKYWSIEIVLCIIHLQTVSLFNMISTAVKTKSVEVRDKVKDYIVQTTQNEEKSAPGTK